MRNLNKNGLNLIKKFEGTVPFVYLCQAGHPTIGCGHLCRDGDKCLRGYSVHKIKDMINNNPTMISNNSCGTYKVESNIEVADITFVTDKEINTLLQKDVLDACKAVEDLITVKLNDNQFAALVSFTFNLGRGALQKSTLRKKLNQCKYGEIPAELNKWVYAGGKILDGLVRRRKLEGELFMLRPIFV